MLPVRDNDLVEIKTETEVIPTLTHRMQIYGDRIFGITDKLEAMKQACYKILNTERYQYPIYSWSYGIELKDLFGKPKSYCKVELTSRITEALLQDERNTAVESFSFKDVGREGLVVNFTVKTIYGEIKLEKGVRV